MIQPDANGLYHPENEDQITELIHFAIQNNLQVRVRGAAQSVPGAVFSDGYDPATPDPESKNINILLDKMRATTFDDTAMQVTVGGGCNLGFDPFDPSETSTHANGLFAQLSQKGWAIPNVPDAIHQTVAGFLSTGSSGCTAAYAFDACVVAIRMVDGTGAVRTFTRSTDLDDAFFGTVASMGLLGVITSVTLQCVPAFDIIGQEAVTPVNQCAFDFFGSGTPERPSLQAHFSQTEYARLLWWPYQTLQRVISWQARAMQPSDYNQQTGTPQDFHPKPYQPVFHKVLGSTLPSEVVAGVGYSLLASWPQWLYDLTGNDPEIDEIEKVLSSLFPVMYPMLCDMYFPVNSPKDPQQVFWDTWSGSLPMDRIEFSNHLMPLKYTEMWVPIGMAEKAVNTMQAFYEKGGFAATGFYTVEVLAARQSDFWLSPGYGQDSLRFNFMWFARGAGDPTPYYQQFWDLFKENNIPFRLHWGKFLPPASSAEGPAYLQAQYPKWTNFMNLRQQMDPNGIFLNTYWKNHLGI
ncbi:MAG: D-arabinono-1,4-lactone oxidase [Saprospiraceae bacterium]